ncbi:acetate--CoA ligase family protein [uncultured Pseudacidovorax sp.]|uniref:acetate--CoA ligase family protein n=1 Tax=uncultured Pseudacidovorax sp. TaxID=679313 RepID=UPI0025EBC4A6|nr:acetate--CoA ligase family protein [uncultured Pseudacidovorax sp.]
MNAGDVAPEGARIAGKAEDRVGSGRPPYDRAQVQRLFEPRSIAVVGVSNRTGAFGERSWNNLDAYTGRRFAVHPAYSSYAGQPCYPDLSSLPEVPDCVLLATGRDSTEALVRQCVELGVGGVVIYASGFAETGQATHQAAQARLAAIAANTGLRLLGPNCMGFANARLKAGVSFATLPRWRPAGLCQVGLVSQSGAVGIAVMQAAERGIAFSHMLTTGNALDVDVADQIAYLAQCDECHTIACILEGAASPARLIAAGQLARAAGKPVVIFKVGRSEAGAAASRSHTGTLAGMDAAYTDAFRRAGMVQVEHLEHLLETALFLGKAAGLRRPLANAAAILSASGGLAIMAVDKAHAHGVPLPMPGPQALSVLRDRIPDFGSAGNPCDMTAQVANDPEAFEACAQALLADPVIDCLVFPHTAATAAGSLRLETLQRLAAVHDKLACIVWPPGWLEGPGAVEAESMTHGALFRSMDACMGAISALRGLPPSSCASISATQDPHFAAHLDAVGQCLDQATDPALSEPEALRLLAAWGIPTVAVQVAHTARAAAEAAAALGFPVAMKIVSRDIPHKSDMGGVRLRIADADGAQQAFDALMATAATAAPGARIDGVAVQPMAAPGVELVVGCRRDPVFGMLVMVGLGGVLVELLKDVAVAIAPVTPTEAQAMLHRLKGLPLLHGFRGGPVVDVACVAGCVSRLSMLAHAFSDRIEAIDINPLICHADRATAVDALVLLRQVPTP